MTLQQYIKNNPVAFTNNPMMQYEETLWHLYNCLDAIGFEGRMGYKDRALLREWLVQIGLPMDEVKQHVRTAIKHPHYQK